MDLPLQTPVDPLPAALGQGTCCCISIAHKPSTSKAGSAPPRLLISEPRTELQSGSEFQNRGQSSEADCGFRTMDRAIHGRRSRQHHGQRPEGARRSLSAPRTVAMFP